MQIGQPKKQMTAQEQMQQQQLMNNFLSQFGNLQQMYIQLKMIEIKCEFEGKTDVEEMQINQIHSRIEELSNQIQGASQQLPPQYVKMMRDKHHQFMQIELVTIENRARMNYQMQLKARLQRHQHQLIQQQQQQNQASPSKKSKSKGRLKSIQFDSHEFSTFGDLKRHYYTMTPCEDVQFQIYNGKKIMDLDDYKCDEPIKMLIIQETSTLSMLNHLKKEEFIKLFIKNTTEKVVIITQEMCFDKFEQRLLPLKNMPKAIKEKYETNEFSLKTPDVAMIGPLVNEFMSLLSKDDLMMDTFNEFINQPGIDKGLKKRYLSLTDPENQLNEIRNRYLNASSKGVFVVASSFILLHTAVKTLKENNIKIGHIKIGHVTEELISNLLLENEVEPSLILINVNIADAFLMGEKFINVYHGVEEYLDLIKGRATINRS